MSDKLFNNLVKLGNQNPQLRDNVAPLLHHLKRRKQAASEGFERVKDKIQQANEVCRGVGVPTDASGLVAEANSKLKWLERNFSDLENKKKDETVKQIRQSLIRAEDKCKKRGPDACFEAVKEAINALNDWQAFGMKMTTRQAQSQGDTYYFGGSIFDSKGQAVRSAVERWLDPGSDTLVMPVRQKELRELQRCVSEGVSKGPKGQGPSLKELGEEPSLTVLKDILQDQGYSVKEAKSESGKVRIEDVKRIGTYHVIDPDPELLSIEESYDLRWGPEAMVGGNVELTDFDRKAVEEISDEFYSSLREAITEVSIQVPERPEGPAYTSEAEVLPYIDSSGLDYFIRHDVGYISNPAVRFDPAAPFLTDQSKKTLEASIDDVMYDMDQAFKKAKKDLTRAYQEGLNNPVMLDYRRY